MAKHYDLLRKYVKTTPKVDIEVKDGQEIVEDYWVCPNFVRVCIVEDKKDYILRYMVFEPYMNEEEYTVISNLISDLKRVIILRDISLSLEERAEYLIKILNVLLDEYAIIPEDEFYSVVVYYLFREFFGYKVIDPLINDPFVEDISCDGYDIPIYVYHRKYGNMETNISLKREELDPLVLRLAQECGKHISLATPMIEGALPNGSRLQATLGTDVTSRGSTFTIRSFTATPMTPIDLIELKTVPTEVMAYLWLCVEAGLSGIVIGETASGKTTTLNAILMFLPPQAKVVSIEDTREIQLHHKNWIAGVTRPGTAEVGAIEMYDLLRAALRQRPDYIIVGEVRGVEAQTLFQAMATGHTCYSTLHAGDINQMIYRLESDPLNVPRSMIQFLDFVLVQAIAVKKTIRIRRTKEVGEIIGIDPANKQILINRFVTWNPEMDIHIKTNESMKIEKVSLLLGRDVEDVKEELMRRMEFLESMREKGIRDYRVVTKLIHAYYHNAEEAFEILRVRDVEDLRAEILG